jgi:hypothetical protein
VRGVFAAARGSEPLRCEPARQPQLHVLPQSDARQRILLRLFVHGDHLLREQIRFDRFDGLGCRGVQA